MISWLLWWVWCFTVKADQAAILARNISLELEGIIVETATIKAGCIPNPDLVRPMWKNSMQYSSCYMFHIFTCSGQKISSIVIAGGCYKIRFNCTFVILNPIAKIVSVLDNSLVIFTAMSKTDIAVKMTRLWSKTLTICFAVLPIKSQGAFPWPGSM